MQYEVFKESLRQMLLTQLGENHDVSFERIFANNDTGKEVVLIRRKGAKLSPAVHLDALYKKVQEEEDIRQITADLVRIYRRDTQQDAFCVDEFYDWEKVKGRLVCRLVSRERNAGRLGHLVHNSFLDLAEIYYFLFYTKQEESAGIAVKSAFLNQWGVTAGMVRACALQNTPRLCPVSFEKMEDIMEEMAGGSLPAHHKSGYPLYVLTNRQRMHGAWWMSHIPTLEGIRERLGDDFYLLPSSIHECIVIDSRVRIDPKEMADMVSQINLTQVEPEEVLTDSVYRYTSGKGLYLAAEPSVRPA